MPSVKVLAGLLAVLVSASSSFGSVIISPEVHIPGTNGLVDVYEQEDMYSGGVSYAVDILDPEVFVYAFAVSNDGQGGGAYTYREGWFATTLDSTQWDAGFLVSDIGDGVFVHFNTAAVGSYSSFFGSDPLVSLYWSYFYKGDGPISMYDDEIFEFFYGGNLASEFVAFSGNGNVISQSLSSAAVPEPGSLTLAGLGALGLIGGAIRRRKQQAA